MLLYRITLAKYAKTLQSSGRAARWNSDDQHVIYTSSSRALACLENVVHRNQIGLAGNFRVLIIDLPEDIAIKTIGINELPDQWQDFKHMQTTRKIGGHWLEEGRYAVLKVPSSIISEENNYLLNPKHSAFGQIRLIRSEPFAFDTRIKR